MDNWQPSTLTWSFSRKAHFDACRRHYFFDRFWGQDPRLRWKLFEMRNITTLTMLRGQVVHAAIGGALRTIRLGIEFDIETAKQHITEVMRARYIESAKKLWHIENRPQDRKISEITNLLEHYYEFSNVVERTREARIIAWQCMENLTRSQLWNEITASDAEEWKEIDEGSFQSFDLDGIQVYAGIDFACSNDHPTIIDWKTGSPSAQDKRQLVLYSLYARNKWEWRPEETELAAVYLYPEFCIEKFSPTANEIEEVADEVKRSFDDMLELEPAFGPADINQFPKTDNTHHCAWCRFQGMCKNVSA